MNVELRRISHYARLSQETTAFAADIYLDGVKSGTAENDGHGGATMISGRGCEDRLAAYARTLPKVVTDLPDHAGAWEPFSYQPDAESVVNDFLDAYLRAKETKRIRAKFEKDYHQRICWIDAGKLYTVGCTPAQRVQSLEPITTREALRGNRVLQTLPIEEAWPLWFAAATGEPLRA